MEALQDAVGSALGSFDLHGGHREFDLAMMRLSRGFGAECFDAYADVHPLADGWEGRGALRLPPPRHHGRSLPCSARNPPTDRPAPGRPARRATSP
jgi:hypothetical protein